MNTVVTFIVGTYTGFLVSMLMIGGVMRVFGLKLVKDPDALAGSQEPQKK